MIRMIAACDRNRIMGSEGTLPWKISEDWEYFLKTTRKGALIMGRKCYEDFLDYVPGRPVVVLSRNSTKNFHPARKARDLQEALQIASSMAKNLWICGGHEIYRESMNLAEELHLTQIDDEFEGDAYFPDWRPHFPHEASRRESTSDGYRLRFSIFTKAPA